MNASYPAESPETGPRPPAPQPDDDARERVVELLSRAYADDVITEAELDDDLGRVWRATSQAELDAVTVDLAPAPSAPVATPGERITALFSGQEQRLTGTVPRELRLRARLGYVELDLTRARFPPGVTEIDVRAFMGYVKIRFPPDVRVESKGRAFVGFFSLTGARAPETGETERVVRVMGRAMFGFAECTVESRRRSQEPT